MYFSLHHCFLSLTTVSVYFFKLKFNAFPSACVVTDPNIMVTHILANVFLKCISCCTDRYWEPLFLIFLCNGLPPPPGFIKYKSIPQKLSLCRKLKLAANIWRLQKHVFKTLTSWSYRWEREHVWFWSKGLTTEGSKILRANEWNTKTV